MKIQVGGLSEGLHEYSFEVPASALGLGENFSENVEVKVVLEKAAKQIFLKAGIRASGVFACDRCLGSFNASLASSYRMNYVMEETEGAGLDPAEVQYLAPGLTIIDLSEDVRQTILLSVPLKLLCSEACKGLCPHCGKNLNNGSCTCTEKSTDPRWEKLRSLRENKTGEWTQN